jgi:uncharacterized damage-inducible protein DinB
MTTPSLPDGPHVGEVARELLEAFERNGRVNEFLVGALPPDLWDAPSPSVGGRSVGEIVAHLLATQRRFAALAAGGPPGADDAPEVTTPDEAIAALRAARQALTSAFERALGRGEGTAGALPRRVVDAITYLMQHDAHHRGQITRQARELGHPLQRDDVLRLFGWLDLP